MNASLHCAAYSYLDEWMWRDSRFYQVMRFDNCHNTSLDLGVNTLVETAAYYGVARTLKKAGETRRLAAAYVELQKTRLSEGDNAIEVVKRLAERLREIYGSYALSAASKFLWMRFRSPIVIYDSIVSKWLQNHGYVDDDYSTYWQVWQRKYSEREEQIGEACADLTGINRFTLACQISDDQLAKWTSSQWFKERVFDHFMMAEIDVAGENSERARLA
jgi:hypothetical protein